MRQIEDLNESSIAFSGDLSSLSLATEYRSLKDDPVQNFYKQCLRNSSIYKRAVGYFRSSVFLVIGPSLLEFSRRGGRTQLVCSPELNSDDIDSIVLGYAGRSERVIDRIIQQIDDLLASEQTSYATRVLATLVQVGSLDIKLAVRADRKGLYHEKIGVFSDTLGNRVSFKGSANETWSGWHREGNFESIEVFCSWRGGLESDRVQRHEAHFDSLWSERDEDVEVFAFPMRAYDHLKKAAFRGLDDVNFEEAHIRDARRQPLPHQRMAHQRWIEVGRRGIFEHATGSGKTFTALMIIKEHTERGLPAIVLVPSRLLLEQWAAEIREEIPDVALLLAGGGHEAWKSGSRLAAMTDPRSDLGGRIVLATMQTAAGLDFTAKVVAGDHLLVVADEVHQMGSPQNSRFFTVFAGARLGLSATPTRYGDPEGTTNILSYFGPVVPPPITLIDAIAAGRLVPYEYYPHAVSLTGVEAQNWSDLTRAIRFELSSRRGDESAGVPLSEKAKMLLIRRSRIAKKAEAKIGLALSIIRNHFEPGQSWLIYCEDGDQLSEVLTVLAGAGFQPVEYHTGMAGDRNATMSWFRSYGGILISIRCLDEGVDIPSVSHAIILASSQNPRQFIQRRGRVLRKAPGKQLAVIHDVIVTPLASDTDHDQGSLLRSELIRSLEFAENAINRASGAELRAIASRMGISASIDNEEIEDGDVE